MTNLTFRTGYSSIQVNQNEKGKPNIGSNPTKKQN